MTFMILSNSPGMIIQSTPAMTTIMSATDISVPMILAIVRSCLKLCFAVLISPYERDTVKL